MGVFSKKIDSHKRAFIRAYKLGENECGRDSGNMI